MYNMKVFINLDNLFWSSDWNGYELGYPESEVVGLYWHVRDDGRYSFYIDIDTNEVLDFWKDEVEE